LSPSTENTQISELEPVVIMLSNDAFDTMDPGYDHGELPLHIKNIQKNLSRTLLQIYVENQARVKYCCPSLGCRYTTITRGLWLRWFCHLRWQ
jgi:hypothetical protein